ncbi:Uncharacterised protein [Salmonella enterica subsp. enterica]|nr:Uncharacterised protein [Salmonella enterica subsp. enterica]
MFFVITHHIDVLPLATLPTHETCPYCNNQDVWLIIRQKRTRTCGLSQARKRDKFGLAICNHCSNEIKENVGHQRYVNFLPSRSHYLT